MPDKISFKPLDNLSHDIPAALVVFLVALPLCLGIALASGAPLFSGLIAGVVGGIVAGTLSGSSLSVSGPAAGLATIVFAAIQELQSFPLFLLAVVMAGVIQVILGLVRAGTIGHFFPVAVIKGMLAAIGLILILKQIPHALGYDADYEGDESFFQPDNENTFTEIIRSFDYLTPGAIVVSAVSLIILVSWTSRFVKQFSWTSYVPGPLVVVVVGIVLNLLFVKFIPSLAIQSTHLVDLGGFSGVESMTSVIQLPDFSGLTDPRIYRIAITIAIVASLESLLSVEATDKLDVYHRITPLNRELRAQGACNIISGLLGGLPVTAVIVRSSANIIAGARTKTSAILHGIFLAVVVLVAPGLLQQIPLASLAGVLLVVGYKLNTPDLYRQTFRKGWDQFLPFAVTIAAILFTDLLVGISIGLLVSLFFVLKSNFQTAVLVVNDGAQYLVKFTKDVSFLHKAQLRRVLEQIPTGAKVVIDGAKSQFVDADIVETIEDFIQGAPSKSIEVELRKTSGASTALFRKDPTDQESN
ncbi:MAG: SulP family inorganic anion transporter [Cyclobacteriaceae bacterium]|nr:SulP family inorganic anion transporter [Cyclobacteriaceae bacterium]